MVGFAEAELEDARVTVDDDRPPVRVVRNVFDAVNGSCREVVHHHVPFERTVERESQQESTVGDQPIFTATSARAANLVMSQRCPGIRG